MHHTGQVGRPQLVERGKEVGCALGVLEQGQAFDGVPFDDADRSASADPMSVGSHGDLGQKPVAGTGALHRDVGHGRRLAGLGQRHLPVQQLAENQRLSLALGESTEADRAGGHHRTRLDTGYPRDRQEDRATRRHFNDQAQHPWLLIPGPEHDDDVAHPADLIAVRVEDDDAGEARDENPRRRPAHERRLSPRARVRRRVRL